MEPDVALQAEAQARGFMAVYASVDLPLFVRERYRGWLESGRNAGMAWLNKNVEARLQPRRRFDWAKSVLVLSVPHDYTEPAPPEDGFRVGRVARYAWVRDYHQSIEPHLEALEGLAARLGGRAKGYVDYGPLSERSHASLAGLGWIGKNAMLIRQGEGSRLTLAVLLTSFEAEGSKLYPPRCGICQRCLTHCPSGALLGGGVLDANLCVSNWTIEHRGLIPTRLWPAIGEWLFGCDVCQTVCPWNHKPGLAWQGFTPEGELAHPDLRNFFTLSSRGFARRYAGSAFLRAGRTRMARNALIVLANRQDPAGLWLVHMGAHDTSPLVRATAAHALALLGDRDNLKPLLADAVAQVSQAAAEALAKTM